MAGIEDGTRRKIDMKKKKIAECTHRNPIGDCFSCKLDYLEENKDKVMTGADLLEVVKFLREEMKWMQNQIYEIEERCPVPYDPQWD